MKKAIDIIGITVAAILSAAACVPLDTEPYDRDSDNSFWKNDPDAAIGALNTCYVSLTDMFGLVMDEGASDNAYIKSGDTKSIGNGSYGTSEGYVYNMWIGHYSGIRDCNELLTHIDLVPGLDPKLKARYVSEARTLRAWHYYELYTRFGGVPYLTRPITIAESRTVSRDSKDYVVEKITAELEDVIAADALPGSYSGEDRGRITKWAARGILARIYLFERNYAKVRDITADIMEHSGIALFNSYEGLFEIDNEYCPEIMLSSQYTPVNREHDIMRWTLPPSMGGYTRIAPLKALVDSYIMLNGKAIGEEGSGYSEADPWTGRDPRLAATVVYPGNGYKNRDGSVTQPRWKDSDDKPDIDYYNYSSDVTPTGYYIRKWWDNTYRLTLWSGLNPIILRYADILLMNAEAHAELGTLTSAVWDATVKPIRQRAGFTLAGALNFPGAAADLKETVRNERRCELAFEGSRRNDIIRWKIAENVLNGWCLGIKTGALVGTEGGYVRIEQRQFDPSKHYLWPIPQKERDMNRNLEQNPKW